MGNGDILIQNYGDNVSRNDDEIIEGEILRRTEYDAKKVNFGKMLRILRIHNGYTQQELAKLLGYKSKGSLSLIERGLRDMSHEKIVKCAELFGVNEQVLSSVDEDFDDKIFKIYLCLKELPKNHPQTAALIDYFKIK